MLASGVQTLLFVSGLRLYACFKALILILLLLLLSLSQPATLQTFTLKGLSEDVSSSFQLLWVRAVCSGTLLLCHALPLFG